MQATRLVLIRHGETDWNVGGRIQGSHDIALNARGRAQARQTAQALHGREACAAVYSSDLARAWETAQAIAGALDAPLVAEPALRERAFGAFEGKSFAEVCIQSPADGRRWRERDPHWAPPGGGENLIDFRARVTRATAALASRHGGSQIALVAHGGVLDVLYRAATGLDLRAARTWKIPNAAINRVLWTPDSGFVLVGWADTAHLEQPALNESAA